MAGPSLDIDCLIIQITDTPSLEVFWRLVTFLAASVDDHCACTLRDEFRHRCDDLEDWGSLLFAGCLEALRRWVFDAATLTYVCQLVLTVRLDLAKRKVLAGLSCDEMNIDEYADIDEPEFTRELRLVPLRQRQFCGPIQRRRRELYESWARKREMTIAVCDAYGSLLTHMGHYRL